MGKLCWKIEGYDGGQRFLTLLAPKGCDPERVLSLLVCRDLSPKEIINACRRSNDRLYFPDPLRVSRPLASGQPFSAGLNPHYTAKLVECGMSESDRAVMQWRNHIQAEIDGIPNNGISREFTFEELFSESEWNDFTDRKRLAKSVTNAFKKRIIGFENARNPIFSGVEWVGSIKRSGRTVNFRKL